MSVGDVGIAVLVAVLWGLAFVATRVGLDAFSPAQLALLRFAVASLPVVALARPAVPWPLLVLTGLTLFAGQFILQFLGMAHGMPPGLASLVVHTQAFFTVLFAAVVLGERPTSRQLGGMAVAVAGLALIAATAGADLRLLGLALTLGSAVSWGIGNVFLKRLGRRPQLDLMIWLSLVPPLPALGLALVADGAGAVGTALVRAPWQAWAAVLYLGLVATAVAYSLWGRLLTRYPLATVAPFSLLVPCVGALASALAFGERFGPMRLAGMACVMLGLAVIVLPSPPRVLRARRRRVSAIVLVVILGSVGAAHAMTGVEWRRHPEPVKRAYVDGVIDAWNGLVVVQESLGGRDRGIAVFADVVTCLRDRLMLPPQIFAIVDRHVEDHPGLRGKDMADIIFAALSLTCSR